MICEPPYRNKCSLGCCPPPPPSWKRPCSSPNSAETFSSHPLTLSGFHNTLCTLPSASSTILPSAFQSYQTTFLSSLQFLHIVPPYFLSVRSWLVQFFLAFLSHFHAFASFLDSSSPCFFLSCPHVPASSLSHGHHAF